MVEIIKLQTQEAFEWERWKLVQLVVPDAELEYEPPEEPIARAAA